MLPQRGERTPDGEDRERESMKPDLQEHPASVAKPLVIHGTGVTGRIVLNHLEVLLGATLGAVAGGFLAAAMSLGQLGEAEGIQEGAVLAVALAITGCVLGVGVALRSRTRGWVVAAATAAAMGLLYGIVWIVVRDPIEEFSTNTWIWLMGGSLLLAPQLALGVVEVVERSFGKARSRPKPSPA